MDVKTPATVSCCCFELRPFMISREMSTKPSQSHCIQRHNDVPSRPSRFPKAEESVWEEGTNAGTDGGADGKSALES